MLEVLTFLSMGLFFVTLVSLYQHYRDRSEKKEKEKYKKPLQSTQGDLWLLEQGYIENGQIWNAVSSDSGSTWYVVEHGIQNPQKLSTLEEKHIQVSLHPQAWQKLKAYVVKNGPINLGDDRGVFLLRQAGFEVRLRGEYAG